MDKKERIENALIAAKRMEKIKYFREERDLVALAEDYVKIKEEKDRYARALIWILNNDSCGSYARALFIEEALHPMERTE